MDFQFWIWVAFLVITFVARFLKKAKEQKNAQQPRPTVETTNEHKPMSFEELLREIQQSKTPPQPPKPVEVPQRRSFEVDYDDNLEEEAQDLETIPVSDDRSYEVYEKAKTEAFYRPSLEDTMKLSDTDTKFGHFKEYDQVSQRSVANEVAQELKNPESLRKAFVMSEILKTKF